MQDRHDLLIQWLRQLNWKERYYLIEHALGTDGFKLSPKFREQLGDEIGFAVPAGAFAAMDYHLDWLYAALKLSDDGITSDLYTGQTENVATGTQLDTDLLVVFRQGDETHVVMVEAKAKGSWDNRQICKKVRRLTAIFRHGSNRWPHVTPHWVLMSPRRERKYQMGYWPTWMKKAVEKPYWIGLCLPERLSSLHQADNSGNPTRGGTHFTVKTKSTKRTKKPRW